MNLINFSFLIKKSKHFIRNLLSNSKKKNRYANLNLFAHHAKNEMKLAQIESLDPISKELLYIEANKIIMSAIFDLQQKSSL